MIDVSVGKAESRISKIKFCGFWDSYQYGDGTTNIQKKCLKKIKMSCSEISFIFAHIDHSNAFFFDLFWESNAQTFRQKMLHGTAPQGHISTRHELSRAILDYTVQWLLLIRAHDKIASKFTQETSKSPTESWTMIFHGLFFLKISDLEDGNGNYTHDGKNESMIVGLEIGIGITFN